MNVSARAHKKWTNKYFDMCAHAFPFLLTSPLKPKIAVLLGLAVTFEKQVRDLASVPCSTPSPFQLHVKQMLVLEVSLIGPAFSVRGVERGGAASLMYGTRCPLPDVVQAYMQVWHEVFQGWP